MQGYIRKILFIYAGVNSIVHFGYGPTVLYMMSNTPEQMKVFGLQGFFGWLIFFVLGIAIAYALAKPVQNGLDQLDGGVATPEGPMDISRRREEDGNDVVANKGAGVNLEDHKPVVDRIPSSGVGSSFVADPQGAFLQSDRGRNSPSTLTGHQCCYPRRFCRRLAGRRL